MFICRKTEQNKQLSANLTTMLAWPAWQQVCICRHFKRFFCPLSKKVWVSCEIQYLQKPIAHNIRHQLVFKALILLVCYDTLIHVLYRWGSHISSVRWPKYYCCFICNKKNRWKQSYNFILHKLSSQKAADCKSNTKSQMRFEHKLTSSRCRCTCRCHTKALSTFPQTKRVLLNVEISDFQVAYFR